MLTAMIVDDEELSVKRLTRLLLESGEFSVCHSFLNPSEAYEFAKANRIDVAFLDISMPAIDGMTLSGKLRELDDSIQLVFATGYGDYAVQAFDINALDYLLKPVTTERLNKTLSRIDKTPRSAPALRVQLLNELKIYNRDGQETPIKLRSPKTEELFAFLLCKRSVSREEIVETLWTDMETDKALKNLNSTLYYIRQAVGADKIGSIMHTGKTEIRLEENGIDCDLYVFERLLKQIRSGPEQADKLLEQAETLYTGELLKGKAFEWAVPIRRGLEQQYIEQLEAAYRRRLATDRPLDSLHNLSMILKLDPLREDIHHEVIRLHIELGNRNEALRQYRTLEKLLQQELGTKPDSRMREYVRKMTR
ncbi:response regulator receiver and SARP domain protein [Paenibacillus cellulosilyticus]|uniref:Response regulator receiver and SARP domain protein n=1 Tax=Paenibacillus cellulosilyticus TaxID=375489 RepID=A0A2V2YDI5_9BACL|nr:BTAD domain-containing putative transcriptional regulator [Paenibacillus cellulosilyticus]PWV88467.1 response regulator receiver and SARP domain protein [Paenibacillus cellulosilyticus]QKS44100.1 response regulator [Paenibacillus cellulosilyticus]